MVGGRPLAVALLWAAVALSGCLADGPGDKAAAGGDSNLPPSTASPDLVVERPARVDGTVTDTNGTALPDVRLLLEGGTDLNLQAASDDAGKFLFEGLPNGTYALLAEKTGFESAQLPFTLTEGETKALEVTMTPLAVVAELRFNTTVLEGNFACGVQTPDPNVPLFGGFTSTPCANAPAATNHRVDLRFVAPPGVKTVLAEFVWTSNAQNGASKLTGNLDAATTSVWREMNQSEGSSPISIRISEGEDGQDEPYPYEQASENVTWRALVTLSDSVALPEVVRDQAFKVYVTLFWNQKAPEDFTAVPP